MSPPRGPPLGNFIEGQVHPNVFTFLQFSSKQVYLFFCVVKFLSHVFFVCFPVDQGFSPRLLCLYSNSFQFKFFIYSLYIHIFIFLNICFHCTVDSLICAG